MKTAPFLLLMIRRGSHVASPFCIYGKARGSRITRTRVIKDVLITQFLPKNSLTYNKRDDKISKCRNESIASKLQDVRSEVS